MNRFLVSLVVLLALPASAQDWLPIDLGTTVTLRAFEQGSSNTRYLVGDDGYVALSSNMHTVWTPEDDVDTTADLISIIPSNSHRVWISGVGGVVRVAGAGGTWSARDMPDTTQDYVLVRRRSTEVLAAGSGGSIWKIIDGGAGWTLQNSGTTTALRGGINQSQGGDGYVVGDDGLILKSTNNGATWMPLPSGTTEDLYDILLGTSPPGLPQTQPRIVAAGANGTILTSDDDGATWTPRDSGTTETLRALVVSNVGSMYQLAVGDGGTVLRSDDNAETWCSFTIGTTTDFYTALWTHINTHFVAGEGGVLLRTETGGGACVLVANEPQAPPAGFALSTVWPNPVRDQATLTLRVDRPQRVTAEVLDVQGRVVASVFAGEVPAGAVSPLPLDVRGFAAGVYVVRVQGETFEDSRRVVVVR